MIAEMQAPNFISCSVDFLVVQACHWPVLDGFYQQFEASTVHFLSSITYNRTVLAPGGITGIG